MTDTNPRGNNTPVTPLLESNVGTLKLRFINTIKKTDLKRKKDREEKKKSEFTKSCEELLRDLCESFETFAHYKEESNNSEHKDVQESIVSLVHCKQKTDLKRKKAREENKKSEFTKSFEELSRDLCESFETIGHKELQRILRKSEELLSLLDGEMSNSVDEIQRLEEMEDKYKEECNNSKHKVVQESIVSLVHIKQNLECDLNFLLQIKKRVNDHIMNINEPEKILREEQYHLSSNLKIEVNLYEKEVDKQTLQEFLLKSQQMLDSDLNLKDSP